MTNAEFADHTSVARAASNQWLQTLAAQRAIQKLRRGVYGLPQHAEDALLKVVTLRAKSAKMRYSAAALGPAFTSAQFAQFHGLEPKTASRYLQRLIDAGLAHRLDYGLFSKEPPFDLTFGIEAFAQFFHLSPQSAAAALAQHL